MHDRCNHSHERCRPRSRPAALVVALLTLAIAGAAGCGSGSGATATTATGATSAPMSRSGFPVSVTNCGQTLRFGAPPKRVVAMDQVATEALFGLGLKSHMVGTANEATPIFPAFAKDYAQVPVLAKGGYPSKEVLLGANPDLVVGNLEFFTYSGFPPGSNFSRAQLSAKGIQGFTLLCTGETKSMPVLYERYLELGKIFGVSARAQAFVQNIKSGLAATTSRLKGSPPVKTFYYRGGNGPLSTYGGAQDGLVLSGGTNLFRDLPPLVGGMPPTVSVEQVISRNPDAILIEDEGALDPKAPPVAAEEAFLRRVLKTTDAVKHNRFCVVGFYDFTGGPRTVQAVRRVAQCLHPNVKF
jgi:iron complex transport system substrate-binding protein